VSTLAYIAVLSAGAMVFFALIGGIFGWLLRKCLDEGWHITLGGAVLGVWIYLFTQLPMHIAFSLGVDSELAPFAILIGGALMWIFWLIGFPKKLPLVGRSAIAFMLAHAKWHAARSAKRIERLEREFSPARAKQVE
jgi:hypothetical protein